MLINHGVLDIGGGTPIVVLDGRYELLDRLGAGGMGEVFRARDRLTDREIALKRVHVSRVAPDTDGDFRLSLAREFSILGSLSHPNIISVLDYAFEEGGQPFFTMTLLSEAVTVVEAARGRDRSGRLDLLFQICEALAYLHRRGILHRDLKPSNVLVQDGRVVLVDFGTSGFAGESSSGQTLSYTAPEVLRGEEASAASDFYAVGVIAYEMLAGNHPFEGGIARGLIHKVLDRPADLAKLKVEPRVANIVGRLLAKEPAERFEEAGDLIEAFASAAHLRVPSESAALRESRLVSAPFVGREVEMDRLERALAHAFEGSGSSWLIGGESGVGKSRLVAETRLRALVRGALMLQGRAVGEGGAPFLLFRDPLLRLILEVRPTEEEAEVLTSIFPAAAKLLGRPPGSPSPDAAGTADRLADVVEALFSRCRRPMVLELEDIHLAVEGLKLLERLNRVVRTLPLLITATYREDERPELPRELPNMACMRLTRFRRDHVARLVASILDERRGGDERLLSFLEQETEGNAFFVIEAIRAIGDRVDRLADVSPEHLPDRLASMGVKSLVRRRLNALPASARPLLQVQAVLGRDVDAEVLRAAAPDTDIDRWLALCGSTAVLEPHGYAWRFRHDKLREAVLDDLEPDQLRELHRRVASAIEAAHGAAPEWINALATHWRMAGDAEKAVPCLVAAAVQMLQSGAPQEAVGLGQDAVRMLGVELPEPQLRGLAIGREMGEIYRLLGGRRPEELLDLPELTDERAGTALKILQLIIPGAHISHQFELFALCVLKCVSLCLEYGNGPDAPFSYATHAVITRGMTGDSRLAYEFGRLAMDLDQRLRGRPSASVGFAHAWFINHWINHVDTSLPVFREAVHTGFEESDITYACFSAGALPIFLRAAGAPLDDVAEQAERSLERIDGRVAVAAFHCRLERQMARALAGRTIDPSSLTDETFDEADIAGICETDNQTQICYFYSAKLRLHYLRGDYGRALRYAEKAAPLLTSFQGQVEEAEWLVFYGLALAACVGGAAGEARARLLGKAAEICKTFRKWADACPANFLHKALLLEAEMSVAAGRDDSEATYRRAAESARSYGFQQYAGLAHERAAAALAGLGDEEASRLHAEQAAKAWRRWGFRRAGERDEQPE